MAIKRESKKMQFLDGSVFLTPEEWQIVVAKMTSKGKSANEVKVAWVKEVVLSSKKPVVEPEEVMPVKVTGNRTRALRTLLKGGSMLNTTELSKKIGLSQKYVRNVRHKMVKAGEIKPTWIKAKEKKQ